MQTVNVVFAVDQYYMKYLSVAVLSLLENNQELEFVIYIINTDISEMTFKRLTKLTEKYNCEVINTKISDQVFSDLIITKRRFSKACYYRLLIQELVDGPKALYLDADLIVNGSIKELYETDITGYFIGAVGDLGFDSHIELGMTQGSEYFNSGVMLININLWKKEKLLERVVEFVMNNPSLIRWLDQCALNAIIDGCWMKLPPKFNLQTNMFTSLCNSKRNLFDEFELYEARLRPIIIHYTGVSKPWQFDDKHPFKKLYWHYFKMTPFYSFIPEKISFRSLMIRLLPNSIIITVRKLKSSIIRKVVD